MILSYFKSAFRAILANKLFSAIHIIGLSIGLAACFIMLMIVIHEYSYDMHNEKIDNICRVYSYTPLSDRNWYGAPPPIANYFKENIPQVEKAARAIKVYANVSPPGSKEKHDSRFVHCVDKELFDILTIPIKQGDINTLYEDLNTVFISESVAEQYFSNENPVDDKLEIYFRIDKELITFKVGGVFKDLPFTSTLKADILLPMFYGEKYIQNRYAYRKTDILNEWLMVQHLDVYLLLNNSTTIESVESLIPSHADMQPNSDSDFEFRLQKLSEIHLNSNYINSRPNYVDEDKLKTFLGVSILILFIACINFVVMSTSRLNVKAKVVGIRKTIGAGKRNIVSIILLESMLYSLLSFPITIGFIELFAHKLADPLNVKLAESFSTQLPILTFFFLLTIIIGIISGIYSVLKLYKLTPLQTIFYKKTANSASIKSKPVLLVSQMIVLIGLIFITIVVKNQTDLFKEIDLGFDTSNLLILDVNDFDTKKYEVFKSELKKHPSIINAGGATDIPPTLGGMSGNISKKNNPEQNVSLHAIGMDYDFIETMGFELLQGRNFEKNFGTDSLNAWILNQTAISQLELKVNEQFKSYVVVGVVKDFVNRTIHKEIPAFKLAITKTKYINELAIKYTQGSEAAVLNWVNNTWGKFMPGKKPRYYFMDEKFDQVYKNDYNFAGLVNASTGLAILIACLGLFGFTVFSTQQRINEIGIRRILGASMWNVLQLFYRQYISLIITASIVGLTIGNYFVNQWQSGFAYKIDIEIHYFLITLVIAVSIILCTVSVYIIKVLVSNPVNSLRYE
jgi:putative ABC transport system permease protein